MKFSSMNPWTWVKFWVYLFYTGFTYMLPVAFSYYYFIWIYSRSLFVSFWLFAFYLLILLPLVTSISMGFFLRITPKPREGEYMANMNNKNFFRAIMLGGIYKPYYRLFTYSPIFSHMAKILGAKVGKETYVSGKITEPYLFEIGNNSFVGGDATINTHSFENNRMILKKVKVGNNSLIGAHSLIMPGVEIGDNVVVAAKSFVPKNRKLPSNTIWAGIPAKRIKREKK